MGKTLIIALILVSLAVGLTFFKDTPVKKVEAPTLIPSSTQSTTQIPKIQTIARNLEVPWALVFLPDNSLLVTEREGRVKLIKDGQVSLVGKITEVKQTGEGGLHGIAIDPGFNNNHFVYLYYTYQEDGPNTLNRVARFTFDGQSLKDQTIIVDKIPGASIHDGGRIKFGPDKLLYTTTGDASQPSLSQDKNSLAGKILRVSGDGKVEVYSYGHRNPQGITWDEDGRLWEVEHGQSATDEINLIEMGKNYGWPEIRGDQTKSGMVSPILHSGTDTWAPGGVAFYDGSIYFGGLRGQALFQYMIDSKQLKTHFKGGLGRIREVVLGPDNLLYITTSNRDGRGTPSSDDDKILRIDPNQL